MDYTRANNQYLTLSINRYCTKNFEKFHICDCFNLKFPINNDGYIYFREIFNDVESSLKNALLNTSSGHRVHYWLMVCAKITVRPLYMYKTGIYYLNKKKTTKKIPVCQPVMKRLWLWECFCVTQYIQSSSTNKKITPFFSFVYPIFTKK